MIRIASFNVENLFARPKVFDLPDWNTGEPVLKAYDEVSGLLQKASYSAADKARIRDLLVTLEIYTVDKKTKAIRRNQTVDPQWAWLRKNRGTFDREPSDKRKNVEIVAEGRGDWIGVELAKEAVDETATRMTARVIHDIGAHILGLVEVEDRPALLRFNHDLLGGLYRHVMLVDGNDDRGIDVAIMTRNRFEIASIRSNVDKTDSKGIVFSRDCADYEIRTPKGAVIHVLVNHFKSQSGGGGPKRKRQAKAVRKIVNELVKAGAHVVVLGDLNEGPAVTGSQAPNLATLFKNKSPLIDCYSLPGFDVGNRPGTFDSCALRNRFDYIFISKSLRPFFTGGRVFRKGLWGSREKRPTLWETYPEITASKEGASDHSAVVIELNL